MSNVPTAIRLRSLTATASPLVSAGLIVVATLPLDWQSHAHWTRVAWLPFLSGLVRPADLLANAVLYVPLGITLQLRMPRDARWAALTIGAMLATSLELAQVWSHDRFPSATDVVMNVAGCVLGAVIVWRWRDRSRQAVLP